MCCQGPRICPPEGSSSPPKEAYKWQASLGCPALCSCPAPCKPRRWEPWGVSEAALCPASASSAQAPFSGSPVCPVLVPPQGAPRSSGNSLREQEASVTDDKRGPQHCPDCSRDSVCGARAECRPSQSQARPRAHAPPGGGVMEPLAEAVPGGGVMSQLLCIQDLPEERLRGAWAGTGVGTGGQVQVRGRGQADVMATGQKSYCSDIFILKILHNLLETSFYF